MVINKVKDVNFMDSVKSRVSYLNGLIDGLALDDSTKEGKIIIEMSSILNQIADEIDDIKLEQRETDEYIDAIDEDLSEVEDAVYCDDSCEFGEDDDDYDDYDEDEECDCDSYVEIECPYCHETVYVDKDMVNDDETIDCPNCHKPLSREE